MADNLQDLLLLANDENQINHEEFLLLFDLNGSLNLVFPYWKYDRFNLDELENDECKAEFRFEKEDIFTLRDVLQLPARIICYNGTNVSSLEALCIFLKRYAYPCRYLDMIHRFGRPVPELCMINNHMLKLITDGDFFFVSMNQPWLSPINLQEFANTIHENDPPR